MSFGAQSIKQRDAWQTALLDLITDPAELLRLLELDPALLAEAVRAATLFPLKVPRGFLARIEKGNPDDPLLKQILPLGAEAAVTAGYVSDPLQEALVNPAAGLLHKYHGRVLVTLTSACAVHCRYCFRREFPYAENNPGRLGWEKIMAYIVANPSINEVILSGGDPLAVSDLLLQQFSDRLRDVPQVKRLRIHTRLPVVLPERITASLIKWLVSLKQIPVVVIHANHPQEINAEVKRALSLMREAGVMLLNQSVLLAGVNDDVEVLARLSEALFDAGVLPYYLHALDKVQGAAHFDLPRARARKIHKKLLERLSGYLVPKLVCELPHAGSKTNLSETIRDL